MTNSKNNETTENNDELLRFKALKKIITGEISQSEVARQLNVKRQTVSLWVKKYKKDGRRPPPKQGPTSKEKIKLYKVIEKSSPRDLNIDYDRWCEKSVNMLLKKMFDKELSSEKYQIPADEYGLEESDEYGLEELQDGFPKEFEENKLSSQESLFCGCPKFFPKFFLGNGC